MHDMGRRDDKAKQRFYRELGIETDEELRELLDRRAKELGLDQDPGPLPELPEGFLSDLPDVQKMLDEFLPDVARPGLDETPQDVSGTE